MADNINALSPISSMPDEREWGTIFGMAEQLVPTGFLPQDVSTPAKAAAIMLKGRELGIPPMYALSNITVIQGKPTANAELMLALVKRAYGRDVIWVESSTPDKAKIGYLVHGKPRYYEFTIAMAELAKLLKPDKRGNPSMYLKYPDAMLRARGISAVCRMEFPEVIGGMYAPGELGEPVRVDEQTGEVISIDVEPRAVPRNTPIEAPSRPVARQTATVEAPDTSGTDWEKASRHFRAVLGTHKITDEEMIAFVKYGGIASGSTKDMTADQLGRAAEFIDGKDNPKAFMEDVSEVMAKKEAKKTAKQQELEAVNAELNAKIDREKAEQAAASEAIAESMNP